MPLFHDLDGRTRAARVLRGVSLGVAAVSAAGLVALSVPTEARAADDSSALTVAWEGGNAGDLQQYQPTRDPASIHYGDFQNVTATVSQTADLTDQVVHVEVDGMTGPTTQAKDLQFANVNATNFVQAMQCWGDPDDPEFYKNCQFGGWDVGNTLATGNPGVLLANGGEAGRAHERGSQYVDVPFRIVQGVEYSSLPLGANSPIGEWFSWQNTNELDLQRVDESGRAQFDFGVQTAAAAPQLGCGNESSATGTRCWLVVVPRGSHTAPAVEGCQVPDVYLGTGIQVGSPVNPACGYWDNRIVVPLDFAPVNQACAAGSTERRSVGSELIQRAFSSWQPALCGRFDAAFSLVTNGDAVTRDQLLSGQVGMAFTNRPLTADGLDTDDERAQLAETDIAYAPVAVSALTVAFVANLGDHIETSIRLNPRLLAKIVTHSYSDAEVLGITYSYEWPQGQWTRKSDRSNRNLVSDPEFKALNPGVQLAQGGASIILVGPGGSDATALVWDYLRADGDARAFLAGKPDPSGMTINPYYLPQGDPRAQVPATKEFIAPGGNNILVPVTDDSGAVVYRGVGLTTDDGAPLCLCDTGIDTFPKAEDALGPQILAVAGQNRRYDVTQAVPYAETYHGAARLLFTHDTNSKTVWDNTRVNPAGEVGDYVSAGRFYDDSVFQLGAVDSASAADYALSTASLQLPNRPGVYAKADRDGMSAALTAQADTSVTGVATTDPTDLPDDAYPLTLVTYAAVNLTSSDKQARTDYANLIEYAASDGQTPGPGRGELPDGYLPMPESLREQALATAKAIRAYPWPDEEPTPTPTPTQPPVTTASGNTTDRTGGGSAGADGTDVPDIGGGGGSDPVRTPQTGYEPNAAPEAVATEGSVPAATGVLGGSLAIGLAGAVASPLLLRRRGALR